MATAFVVMQIGNKDLDHVYDTVIRNAVTNCGLDVRRVDRHNEGGLLKTEIIRFIKDAEIIVADLTNERPNCYLEVGYAFGHGKTKNVILTAREDHNVEHPGHVPGGPKIHFDLAGYDILFWNPADPDGFRSQLEKRIQSRRRQLATDAVRTAAPEWLQARKDYGRRRMIEVGASGFMELSFLPSESLPALDQQQLLGAARDATIHSFGWPIGAVLQNEHRPRPMSDGIVAEIAREPLELDHWALHRAGPYYLIKTLFEDRREPGKLQMYFNSRIVRVAEALWFCGRLYKNMGLPDGARIAATVTHSGLKGRELSVAGPRILHRGRICHEAESTREVTVTVGDAVKNVVELTKAVCSELFMLFDMFTLDDSVYAEIVEKYIEGGQAT